MLHRFLRSTDLIIADSSYGATEYPSRRGCGVQLLSTPLTEVDPDRHRRRRLIFAAEVYPASRARRRTQANDHLVAHQNVETELALQFFERRYYTQDEVGPSALLSSSAKVLAAHCAFLFVRLFSCLMKGSAKAKGETKSVPFDPILFAATVPARKPTGKDLKDVAGHENDPIEPKDHDGMDDAVADL